MAPREAARELEITRSNIQRRKSRTKNEPRTLARKRSRHKRHGRVAQPEQEDNEYTQQRRTKRMQDIICSRKRLRLTKVTQFGTNKIRHVLVALFELLLHLQPRASRALAAIDLQSLDLPSLGKTSDKRCFSLLPQEASRQASVCRQGSDASLQALSGRSHRSPRRGGRGRQTASGFRCWRAASAIGS